MNELHKLVAVPVVSSPLLASNARSIVRLTNANGGE